MNILIVYPETLPAIKYGGSQRVVWSLLESLHSLGHSVDLLSSESSRNPFGRRITADSITMDLYSSYDVIHFHQQPNKETLESLKTPYIVTVHGNSKPSAELDINSVFVSRNHAERHGSSAYVFNGLNWSIYPKPSFQKTNDLHFLGNAAWKVKNLKGAINTVHQLNGGKLHVLGGKRLNWKMGLQFYPSIRTKFHGMVDDRHKADVLDRSSALLFPVRWHEPFGLSIIESLYFGCIVFGTPYGSLPELVGKECGFLSHSSKELADALSHRMDYDRKMLHEYARERFHADEMAKNYLSYYETVMEGKTINAARPVNSDPSNALLHWEG